MLQSVYQFTRDPEFEGRVAFLEDYDMHLAHLLVQGVDLWLNLPRVPLEASGTSGMKAALNGVPQLSTLDGWWQEGYDGLSGWAISPGRRERGRRRRATPSRLYRLLEEQVVPLYYTRNAAGVPLGWVEKMRHALRLAGRRFTARRMVQDYVQEYYAPAIRGELVRATTRPRHEATQDGTHARDRPTQPLTRPGGCQRPSSTWRRSTSPTPAPAAWPRR